MIKKVLLGVVLLSCTLVAQTNTTTRFFYTYDKETLTVSNSAVGFTASKVTSTSNPINSASYVTFTVNCASGTSCVLRMMTDGSSPTTTTGLRAPYGTIVQIYNHTDIVNFKGIRETSTDVVIDVQYAR